MKAMVLPAICNLAENPTPLKLQDIPMPQPGKGEILVKISACGVCHTELDEIEGRTPPPSLPIVLGHQAVGKVEKIGPECGDFSLGDRVGIAWIYSACGQCQLCREGKENLCSQFTATGRDVNGGYSQYMKVKEKFAYPIPPFFSNSEAAPLLCAGAIGYRSLRLSNLAAEKTLGLTGFGASGHLVMKIVMHKYPGSDIFVFARSPKEREFALELGAVWAGDIGARAPELLDTIIDTTPAWKPVVEALANLTPGGRLVINAIRKEEIDKDYLLNLDYPAHLWMEKEIKSVANVERHDVREFLQIAAEMKIKPELQEYPLQDANQALMELKERKIRGAKVLVLD